MHPRMLARDSGCSGGTCPAVYDAGPRPAAGRTRDPGQEGRAPSSSARLRPASPTTRQPSSSSARSSPTHSARPPSPSTLAELQAQFETFSYSAFRLETLQSYAGTGRDDQWIALLKANRRWGKTHQRVHVVTEPLTPAMQQELTEGYEGNVAAGRGHPHHPRRRPRRVAGRPALPGLLAVRLQPAVRDALRRRTAQWAGAERVRDPESIVKACRVRDAGPAPLRPVARLHRVPSRSAAPPGAVRNPP